MSQTLFKNYLKQLSLKNIPQGNFYHRFHRRDINRVLIVPCPTLQEAEQFKTLRALIGVKEDYVCPQCPHNKTCELAFKQYNSGDMQTLELENLGLFLERAGEAKMTLNDEKQYWLSAMRLIDTFHAVVENYQNINSEFLNTVSDGIPLKEYSQQKEKKEKQKDKYYKKVDNAGEEIQEQRKNNYRDRDQQQYHKKEYQKDNTREYYQKDNRREGYQRDNRKQEYQRDNQRSKRDNQREYQKDYKERKEYRQNRNSDNYDRQNRSSDKYERQNRSSDNYERKENYGNRYNKDKRNRSYDGEQQQQQQYKQKQQKQNDFDQDVYEELKNTKFSQEKNNNTKMREVKAEDLSKKDLFRQQPQESEGRKVKKNMKFTIAQ